MRRNVRATLVVLVAMIATLAFAPASQAASLVVGGQRYTQVSDFPTYSGWARLGVHAPDGFRAPPCQSTACATERVFSPAHIDFTPTYDTFWRWNGSGWGKASLLRGQWVWVAPYGAGWSWIWTEGTGWLAAPDAQLFAPR